MNLYQKQFLTLAGGLLVSGLCSISLVQAENSEPEIAGRSVVASHQMLQSGLKAIDLLAPIPIGGDVLVSGDKRSGARMLGIELVYRMLNRPGRAFPVIVFLDTQTEDLEVFTRQLQESIPTLTEIVKTPSISADDIRRHRATLPRELVGSALFAFSRNEKFISAFGRAVETERARKTGEPPLTTFLVTEGNAQGHFDASLISTSLLAQEGVYPALDINASSSIVSSSNSLSSRQRDVAASLRTALKEVVAHLHSGAFKDPLWDFNRNQAKHPAAQALQFIGQPYFTAEPYTGLKSAFVPVEVAIDNFDTIIRGRLSQSPLKDFQMKNELAAQETAILGQQLTGER